MTRGAVEPRLAAAAVALEALPEARFRWMGLEIPVDGDAVAAMAAHVYRRCHLPGRPVPGTGAPEGAGARDPALARALALAWGAEPTGVAPGFLTHPADPAAGPLVRVYLNPRPGALVVAAGLAAAAADTAGCPFALKTVWHPDDAARTDAVVLAVPRAAWGDIRSALARIAASRALHPRAPVPAFARRLAPGVGVADDPGAGRSAGFALALLVASAARECVGGGPGDRVAALRNVLLAAGRDPSRPHLAPGAEELPWDRPARRSVPARPGPVDGALRIGRDLSETCITWNGMRTWVQPDPATGGAATTGPDLYRGTAGIALALGELHAATGDRAVGAAASAAARHAVTLAGGLTTADLFTGLSGVALAAVRVGRAVGSQTLVDQGRRLAAGAARAPAPSRVDLVGGRAGDIIGLAVLAAVLGDDALAAAAGARALALATSASAAPGDPGAAHGSAGVAMALLVGGRLTADPRSTAEARRMLLPRTPPRGAAGWCHGAAGTAAARLSAGPGWCAARLHEDLRATARMLAAAAADPAADPCLCHGTAGQATILAAAGGGDVRRRLVIQVTDDILARHARPGVTIALGPGLMDGAAGLVWYLLGASRRQVPSFLVPDPRAW